VKLEEVDYLCRVGPGTPTGETFRRFWIPALLAKDVAEPDGDPVPVTLLGERLVAFRDTVGKVGIIDELCAHRGVSLVTARNDGCGLRCIYHGWKYDVEGRIVDTPNMAPGSTFKDRNRVKSYPVREAGGLIWTYMGPPEEEPPFPHYSWFDVDPQYVDISETVMECNYLQVQEGSIDSSHVGVLHHGMLTKPSQPDPKVMAADGRPVRFGGWVGQVPLDGSPVDNHPTQDMSPTFEVENTEFGFQYAAIRSSIYGSGQRYVRVTAFAFPYIAFIPPTGLITITVPLDDYRCTFIGVLITEADSGGAMKQRRAQDEAKPNTGREGRVFATPRQDRRAMRNGTSFSGYYGVTVEDAAAQMAMGQYPDRANEHLVAPADAAVLRFRLLLKQEAARVAQGQPAKFTRPALDTAKIEAGSGIIPDEFPWRDLVPGNQSHQIAD
jgi:phthalate 4,5-dioxygenase oxygenase subunit